MSTGVCADDRMGHEDGSVSVKETGPNLLLHSRGGGI